MKSIADTLCASVKDSKRTESGVVKSIGPFQLAEFVINMSALSAGIAAAYLGLENDENIVKLCISLSGDFSATRLALFPEMLSFLDDLMAQEDTGWSEDGEENWNTLPYLAKRWNERMEGKE